MEEKNVYTLEDLRDWKTATAGLEKPIRLAVFGDPVEHSASPLMHNAALEQMGQAYRYARVHVKPDELEEAIKLAGENDFLGVNLTLPHKNSALRLVGEVDDQARKLGAINTVLFEHGESIGFNTDGPGFVRAIRSEFYVDVKDLRVLVLGAGGAGRAIAVQCALERCAGLILANRTLEKAERLAQEVAPYFESERLEGPGDRLQVVPWTNDRIAAVLGSVDLVVNATSVGLRRSDPPVLPAAILLPHLMVYDTIYVQRLTRLCMAAQEAGARWANGFSMLLWQGVLALEIWLDRDAPVEVMRQALKETLGV